MKHIKLIGLNLLFLLIAFILLEISSFILFICINFEEMKHASSFKYYKNWFSSYNFRLIETYTDYRPVVYKDSTKRPIVLFGCSHTHGSNLENKDTFGNQLAEYTGRTVYNCAVSGSGTSSMLYLLSNEKFKEKVPDAEYFIYVFISDHLRRNYTSLCNPIYNEFFAEYILDKNNKLKFVEKSKLGYFLRSLYTYRVFINAYSLYKFNSFDIKLFEKILQNSQIEIAKNYKNAKFYIFVIDFYEGCSPKNNDLKKEIDAFEQISNKNKNFNIINSRTFKNGKDIMQGKYMGVDTLHPTGKLWEDIIPEFVENLGL